MAKSLEFLFLDQLVVFVFTPSCNSVSRIYLFLWKVFKVFIRRTLNYFCILNEFWKNIVIMNTFWLFIVRKCWYCKKSNDWFMVWKQAFPSFIRNRKKLFRFPIQNSITPSRNSLFLWSVINIWARIVFIGRPKANKLFPQKRENGVFS